MKKLGFGLMRLPKINGEIDIEQVKSMADAFLSNGFTYLIPHMFTKIQKLHLKKQ